MAKKIRKYNPVLIEVHVTAARAGIARINQWLDLRVPGPTESVLEERLLLSEIIDWLETRRDVI